MEAIVKELDEIHAKHEAERAQNNPELALAKEGSEVPPASGEYSKQKNKGEFILPFSFTRLSI